MEHGEHKQIAEEVSEPLQQQFGERILALLTVANHDRKVATEMLLSPLTKAIETYVMESQYIAQEQLITTNVDGDVNRGRIDAFREVIQVIDIIRKDLQAG